MVVSDVMVLGGRPLDRVGIVPLEELGEGVVALNLLVKIRAEVQVIDNDILEGGLVARSGSR